MPGERTSKLRSTVVLLLGLITFQLSNAQDNDASAKPSDDRAVEERDQTSQLHSAEVKRWKFTAAENRTPLEISAEPAMRWSYFDNGRYYGDLHVVTAEKRPVAVFALFRWFEPVARPYSYFCATCLDDSQIVASRDGEIQWRPRASSLKWKPLPNEAPPKSSRPIRLAQMRRIASRFSGEVSERPLTNDTTMKKLRLLPQPIYRYSTDASHGAIFAFANGTTPAVLLCVEAELNHETPSWRYGIARRWSFESRMKHNDKEVWMAPRATLSTSSKAPYYIVILDEKDAK